MIGTVGGPHSNMMIGTLGGPSVNMTIGTLVRLLFIVHQGTVLKTLMLSQHVYQCTNHNTPVYQPHAVYYDVMFTTALKSQPASNAWLIGST